VAVIRHCAACTELLPDNARFCPGCGQPVSGHESAAALDESIGHALATELRHLTVLFCDLVGSTELSSTIDPEEYSDLIQAYQQQAVTIVRSLGGGRRGLQRRRHRLPVRLAPGPPRRPRPGPGRRTGHRRHRRRDEGDP